MLFYISRNIADYVNRNILQRQRGKASKEEDKMDTMISYYGSGWMLGTGDVQGRPDKTMTEKEWKAYLKKIDEVEEVIREQIREEGEQNLAQADDARERRREIWQEQWEEMGLSMYNVKIVQEAGMSDHELLVQEPEASKQWVPYSEYMQGNNIVYNGVVFGCDPEHHTIFLGDVSDVKNVINIPLASGGVLLVNRNQVGSLAKAIGMFSAEDVGRILRALEEDKQIQKNLHTIEEEEKKTVENLASDTEADEEK
jgi:hypothetical protein